MFLGSTRESKLRERNVSCHEKGEWTFWRELTFQLISLTCVSNMCLILQSISDTIWHPLTKNLTSYKALLFGFNLFMELYTMNHRMFLCDIVIHTEHPCEDWLEPL